MNLCGAITYDGRTCKRIATHNGRCRWHGGFRSKSQKQEHQSSNGGKWTNALPQYLVEHNESTDPNRFSLRSEIALVDARIEDLLSQAISAEGPSAWVNIQSLIEQRRRLVECELRGTVLTFIHHRRDDAAAVMDAYDQVIRQHISDPDLCHTIHTEVEKLLSRSRY